MNHLVYRFTALTCIYVYQENELLFFYFLFSLLLNILHV
jgi:hypothetical protein